jgi:hypothetical protein
VHHWIAGTRTPGRERWSDLAAFLGCEVEEITRRKKS